MFRIAQHKSILMLGRYWWREDVPVRRATRANARESHRQTPCARAPAANRAIRRPTAARCMQASRVSARASATSPQHNDNIIASTLGTQLPRVEARWHDEQCDEHEQCSLARRAQRSRPSRGSRQRKAARRVSTPAEQATIAAMATKSLLLFLFFSIQTVRTYKK